MARWKWGRSPQSKARLASRQRRWRERELGYSQAEVAAAFGLHRQTVNKLVRNGLVPFERPGPARTKITPEGISAMVALGYKLRI